MNIKIVITALLSAAAIAGCSGGPAYKNTGLSPEKRAADLVKRMSLEEKAGQLLCPLGWPMYDKVSADSVTYSKEFVKFIDEQHGGMLWATFRADPWTQKTIENGLNPTLAAKACNALQRYAIEHSRFGIPIVLAEETPHGHMAIGTTVFPTSIGLAATWDPELIEQVGKVIGRELRAQGGSIGYGPVVDLARELRWSRVEETYGEDVFLTSSMASAMARGTGCSTLKHFIAYGIPEGGHNGSQSIVGERDLRENFLPAFQKCIEAGAVSVMTSYNSMDGIPSTANEKMLTGILRNDWGFGGFVVSDLVSIDGLWETHHIASDRQDAGIKALVAGCDVDLGAACYALLPEAVKSGKVDEKYVDRACRRVLEFKFRSGLFDNPYVDESMPAQVVRTQDNKDVAYKAALEGVTLLKNNGVLPLGKNARIAVLGPNADTRYNQLGDYTAPQTEDDVITPLEGLLCKGLDVTYVKGCAIRDTKNADIARAAAAARAADVAVVVVGGSSARDFKTSYQSTGAAIVDGSTVSDMESGEGFDRVSLSLMGRQEELLKAVKATGTPVVVVYIEGRPLDKNWAVENADALLTQWYPGQEGGRALADVLMGDYNPAGRLPVSIPRSVGQLPVYYNRRIPAGHDYVEMPNTPLYPFGYGLSYTSFDYKDLKVSWPDVCFTLTNIGSRDGEEVAQLYITDLEASTVRPAKQLRAYKRVALKAGESKTVSFKLSEEDLAMYNASMEKVVEPGEFRIAVGSSSADLPLETVIFK